MRTGCQFISAKFLPMNLKREHTSVSFLPVNTLSIHFLLISSWRTATKTSGLFLLKTHYYSVSFTLYESYSMSHTVWLILWNEPNISRKGHGQHSIIFKFSKQLVVDIFIFLCFVNNFTVGTIWFFNFGFSWRFVHFHFLWIFRQILT